MYPRKQNGGKITYLYLYYIQKNKNLQTMERKLFFMYVCSRLIHNYNQSL